MILQRFWVRTSSAPHSRNVSLGRMWNWRIWTWEGTRLWLRLQRQQHSSCRHPSQGRIFLTIAATPSRGGLYDWGRRTDTANGIRQTAVPRLGLMFCDHSVDMHFTSGEVDTVYMAVIRTCNAFVPSPKPMTSSGSNLTRHQWKAPGWMRHVASLHYAEQRLLL